MRVPRLIIGLGNPGREYAGNRHNIGRMAAQGLARELKAPMTAAHPKADLARARVDGHEAIIAVTHDFMNRCGFGVAALCHHFSIDPSELVIVHDDLDLQRSQLRIRRGGSSGGHNGLKSIIEVLGSADFIRVRMGIGRPPGKIDPAEFVLSDFNAIEWAEMEFCYIDALAALRQMFTDGLEAAMNKYNRKPEEGPRGSRAAGGCD